MKLLSMYLNPFQPYPERNLGTEPDGTPRSAIEDNLSRAVFAALASGSDARALVAFLCGLVPDDASPALTERLHVLLAVLETAAPDHIEVGLQGWPDRTSKVEPPERRVLIGVSSSHTGPWTPDQRQAPESPCIDAWIRVPGQALLGFEFKTDDHPLDATQMSAYAHELGLLDPAKGVPCAAPGTSLANATEARAVQEACRDVVADLPWSRLLASLRALAPDDTTTRWLVGQAIDYLSSHVRPPYRGTGTVLDWLEQPDNPSRRGHLRALLGHMGDALHEAGGDDPAAIQFHRGKGGAWDIKAGAEAAAYVPLTSTAVTLAYTWLKREVRPVLWFAHQKGSAGAQVGLEFYAQAHGAQPVLRKDVDALDAWNAAQARVAERRKSLETLFDAWAAVAPQTCRVTVSAVRFQPNKRIWQGGGVVDPTGPRLDDATPQEAAAFLRQRGEPLWRFPTATTAEDVASCAAQVRKPALSLVAPLDLSDFRAAGDDGAHLQRVLRQALDHIVPILQATTA